MLNNGSEELKSILISCMVFAEYAIPPPAHQIVWITYLSPGSLAFSSAIALAKVDRSTRRQSDNRSE